MKKVHYLKALNDPEENQKIVHKLPRNISERWSGEVDHWSSKKEQVRDGLTRNYEAAYPPFSAFCDLMRREARIAFNPIIMTRAKEEEKKEEAGSAVTSKTDQFRPVALRSILVKSRAISAEGKEIKNHLNVAACARTFTTWMEVVKSSGLC